MTNRPTASKHNEATPTSDYLTPGESIVLVDDSPEILLIFESLLTNDGFTVFTASNAKNLYEILARESVALVLLDIGLPDQDGTEVLKDIISTHQDLSIIMLTGTTDLKVVLSCLRQGADDYLTKPVNIEEFNLAIRRTLQKRRLTLDNRIYQKQLELSNYRARFLHQLNLKMNSAYLNSIELETVLQSILVGITAEEGLKFNRAFLLLFNKAGTKLQGKTAIGSPSKADAGKIWDAIKQDNLHLGNILNKIKKSCMTDDTELNRAVKELTVAADDHDHILIQACSKRVSMLVQNGFAGDQKVAKQLIDALQEDNFIITPLFSPDKSLGVIIADNFVTAQPISTEDINSLEIFASQASLAIEHSHLYQTMRNKINELEHVTQELEKNKDLLVETERYSALGHMSAQLVHMLRNPITSIGGIARLLAKKCTDEKNLKFLNMMIMESSKIESTLEDLFNFVGDQKTNKQKQPLYPLIRRSIMLLYGAMKKQSITYDLTLPSPEPELYIDGKLIRQMLLHLIRNALEAMQDGGTLAISCKEENNNVIISIRDSGHQIESSTIDRVTDPFFTTKTYGTGMGLTLVEKIIEEHQGKFTLKHNEDKGMTAQIILPRRTDSIEN